MLQSTLHDQDVLARDVWCLMGLPFDAVTTLQAIEKIETSISEQSACFLSTPNLNFVVASQSDEAFFDSVIESDLVVADGMPIVWVAKLLGIPLFERVAGSSLFSELSSKQNVKRKVKVFFFGGLPRIAERAHDVLNSTSSGMSCCGFHDPGFVSVDEMSSSNEIDKINEAEPDFLVVALGAKKGQAWIQKNRTMLNTPVISHLGAVINFVAGTVERAPNIWQKMGLEWLWRIKQEPALWQRYLVDGGHFFKLLLVNIIPLWILNKRLSGIGKVHTSNIVDLNDQADSTIVLAGSVEISQRDQVVDCFRSVRDQFSGNVVIDCTNLEYIDSACLASLLLFQSELKARNRILTIKNLTRRIKLIFKLNQVYKRFSISELS